MKFAFIGDVYGRIRDFEKLIKDLGDYNVIQIGDMGAGFCVIPPFPKYVKWIRGNHDNPKIARGHDNYLGDYGVKYFDFGSLFYLAGAWSIDRSIRIEGRDWWPDEELSLRELNEAVEIYNNAKPEIVVTHECPMIVTETLLRPFLLSSGPVFKTKTGQALQSMFEMHKPKYWIFGHYHINTEFNLLGTNFNCVAELSVKLLDTATMFSCPQDKVL